MTKTGGRSGTGGSGPILIVDDDQASRQLVAHSLGSAGYRTVEADNGCRALELIRQNRVAAVMLDLRMSGMEGLDVLKAVRARRETKTLPVILVTGEGDVGERVRGLEAGANDYVVKPFEPEELVARLASHLRVEETWRDVVDCHLRERAVIANALSQARSGASLEATADLVCAELQALGHLSGVALLAFVGNGVAVPLAARQFRSWNLEVGRPLPKALAGHLAEKAAHGPWLEYLEEDSPSVLLTGFLPRPATLACAPLCPGGQVEGVLVLGADPPGGRASAEDGSRVLSEAIYFADVAAGLLGLALHNRRQGGLLKGAVEQILEARTFASVFQAIVRLDDGEEVGYEALTRFADGARPDLRFAEAADVDLGTDLELATIKAALEKASDLPSGGFLSVNVSPALAMMGEGLCELVAAYDRPLVLELSEHDPVDDYEALRSALKPLPKLRLSIDDAGSGFASLRHVLALEPDFVKLDRSWVSGIDSDPARQSLVAGLEHFADATGCHLIAEGIESEDELGTLRELGVALGQGFLLGRPQPVGAFSRSGRSGHLPQGAVLDVTDEATEVVLARDERA